MVVCGAGNVNPCKNEDDANCFVGGWIEGADSVKNEFRLSLQISMQERTGILIR